MVTGTGFSVLKGPICIVQKVIKSNRMNKCIRHVPK